MMNSISKIEEILNYLPFCHSLYQLSSDDVRLITFANVFDFFTKEDIEHLLSRNINRISCTKKDTMFNIYKNFKFNNFHH